jgi:hypothetical protein
MSDALIPLMPNLHILPAGPRAESAGNFAGTKTAELLDHATTSLMLLYLIPARRLKVRTRRWLRIRSALLYCCAEGPDGIKRFTSDQKRHAGGGRECDRDDIQPVFTQGGRRSAGQNLVLRRLPFFRRAA